MIAAGFLILSIVFANAQTDVTPSAPHVTASPAGSKPPMIPAAAQSAPDGTPAPVISDAHLKDFFKAQLAILQAEAALGQARAAGQPAIDELTRDCGGKFHPIMGSNGDPICQANPPLPTATKK